MLLRIHRARAFAGMSLWFLTLLSSVRVLGDDAAVMRSSAPVKVLILSAGGGEDARSTVSVLRRILSDSGRFDVKLCESPVGLTASTLEGFDVLIDDISGASPGGRTEDAIGAFVESGKGLVVTHSALASTQRRPKSWPLLPTGESVGKVKFLDIKVVQPEHPIVRGMKSGFRTADVLPRVSRTQASAEVIATSPAEGASEAESVLIASDFGKGRVVAIAIGHDASAMHENTFRAVFARSCEWAATGVVTLPDDLGPSGPASDAVKALLITGGHDHETAFYSLFNGDKDLHWLPVTTSADAFKKDLRGKYQVVIMYDFTRDLDDAAKKNLQDFIESGGGIVVLHHALLNYQNWNWWDDEVVGGSYRLTKPSSAVKDDQQIFVTPVGDHPILAGIAPSTSRMRPTRIYGCRRRFTLS